MFLFFQDILGGRGGGFFIGLTFCICPSLLIVFYFVFCICLSLLWYVKCLENILLFLSSLLSYTCFLYFSIKCPFLYIYLLLVYFSANLRHNPFIYVYFLYWKVNLNVWTFTCTLHWNINFSFLFQCVWFWLVFILLKDRHFHLSLSGSKHLSIISRLYITKEDKSHH